MSYKITKYYLTKNDCYKKGRKRSKTTGILRHDTAAGNPNLKRYIDDSKKLGKNPNGNHWNQSGIKKCVHFMIGLDKDGEVAIYQLLPLDYVCWGCGSGRKGSYNNTHIQYEILDDGYKSREYFEKVMKAADWLDAYLCKKYNLSFSDVICHYEGYQKGYATNHNDIIKWLRTFGKDMSWVRSCVKKELTKGAGKVETKGNTTTASAFEVVVATEVLNIRKAASVKAVKAGSVKKGTVQKITETKNAGGYTWGKLANGKGWIALDYTHRK